MRVPNTAHNETEQNVILETTRLHSVTQQNVTRRHGPIYTDIRSLISSSWISNLSTHVDVDMTQILSHLDTEKQ